MSAFYSKMSWMMFARIVNFSRLLPFSIISFLSESLQRPAFSILDRCCTFLDKMPFVYHKPVKRVFGMFSQIQINSLSRKTMRTTWPLTKWKLQVKTVSRLQILKKNLQKIDFWNRVGAIFKKLHSEIQLLKK